MKKTLLVLALSFALVALAGVVFAQGAPAPAAAAPAAVTQASPPPPTMQPRSDIPRPVPCILPTLRLINPLSSRLSLTDDQKTKVTDLLSKADADLKSKIESQAKIANDYITVLINTSATQADLTAAAEKAMKAETDVLMQRIQTLFALRALLTPEQNKQLSDYLAQATIPWSDRPHMSSPMRGNVPPAATPPAAK